MIPKIIHYTWFSGDPFPEKEKGCIKTWHKYMPDYQYVLWDMKKIKDEFGEFLPIWLEESLSVKKWAFAADYIRQYAVFKYGGIYLDTDCLVFQSFNELLHDVFFIGREGVEYPNMYHRVEVYLTSHCFGAIAGHPFLRKMLDYYEGRHFIMSTNEYIPNFLRFDMLMLPYIQAKIAEIYGYQCKPSCSQKQILKDGIIVYPYDYFGVFGNTCETKNTRVRHLASGSWREYKSLGKVQKISLLLRLKVKIANLISVTFRHFNYILIKCD